MKLRTCLLILLLMALAPCWVWAETSTRIFQNFNASNGLADNSAQTIVCTKTGRLVITTMGQINFYDGQRFTYIDPTEEDFYKLKDYRGNYHLYFDIYHHLWLKNTHCVSCVDLSTERYITSIDSVFADFGMNNQVSDMFVSSDGVVWLLNPDGLFSVKTKKNIKIRRDLNLQDLEVVGDRNLMLFYENGLLEVFDIETVRRSTRVRHTARRMPSVTTSRLYSSSTVPCVTSCVMDRKSLSYSDST